jgi:IPT/TIG domain-containing protein
VIEKLDPKPLRSRLIPLSLSLATHGAVVALMLVLPGCGHDSGPAGPSNMPPTIAHVAPDAGATTGGTAITISGSNFTSGAIVTIGGVAATNVVVKDSATLSAKTGPHSAGAASVVVSVNGMAATLSDAFTYANPGPENNPAPKITALVAKGSRPNEPAQFADLGESIALTATVTDDETPIDQLAFQWTADNGTLTGEGPSVTWKAPDTGSTPLESNIRVTIVERYITTDSIIHENTVSQTTTVSVHNSPKEVGDLSVQFLTDFSHSEIPPETVVRNFTDKCKGKAAELSDVKHNRNCYVITDYSVGSPTASIQFDSVCPFRARAADACIGVPVRWVSTGKGCSGELAEGATGVSEGTDWVTSVYLDSKWYLCDSDFEGSATTTSTMRRFKK